MVHYFPRSFGTSMLRMNFKVQVDSLVLHKKRVYLGYSCEEELPPSIKRLLKIRDILVEKEGSIVEVTNLVDSWVVDDILNTSLAYDYFKGPAALQIWAKIVWDRRFPLKFSFLLLIGLANYVTDRRRMHHISSLLNEQDLEETYQLFRVP
ncbi:hypothetical protein M9H77_07742 [Catharanthus roseus]|uniref:Uncharacterized protein n=1 Tax=Catharanthus roseus TaxID=4058 RepID=A0ACC0BVS9_CATRO|nr:hypothetical protein M9H77_07742 [Catharanthus roseus]